MREKEREGVRGKKEGKKGRKPSREDQIWTVTDLEMTKNGCSLEGNEQHKKKKNEAAEEEERE